MNPWHFQVLPMVSPTSSWILDGGDEGQVREEDQKDGLGAGDARVVPAACYQQVLGWRKPFG